MARSAVFWALGGFSTETLPTGILNVGKMRACVVCGRTFFSGRLLVVWVSCKRCDSSLNIQAYVFCRRSQTVPFPLLCASLFCRRPSYKQYNPRTIYFACTFAQTLFVSAWIGVVRLWPVAGSSFLHGFLCLLMRPTLSARRTFHFMRRPGSVLAYIFEAFSKSSSLLFLGLFRLATTKRRSDCSAVFLGLQ